MLTKDERASRRVGRMEALITDLGQLPANYQPTELETQHATELMRGLAQVFAPKLRGETRATVTTEQGKTAPAPVAEDLKKEVGQRPEVLESKTPKGSADKKVEKS